LDAVKALIIDDVADMRELLQTVLEEWNIVCVPAENGKQALEILKTQGPFDFCTVDIHMPVMDGFSFVKAARQDPALAGVKLLVVTTEVEQSAVDTALRLGADEYLMKPFMRDMIEGKLRLLNLLP
jgi:two-component system chemotaxis response regulator CheY